MFQFHKNSPEMGKCIICRKLLTILILDPGSLWKSAFAHTQSISLLLQNHLLKENISMKKNIPPSISLSALRPPTLETVKNPCCKHLNQNIKKNMVGLFNATPNLLFEL